MLDTRPSLCPLIAVLGGIRRSLEANECREAAKLFLMEK